MGRGYRPLADTPAPFAYAPSAHTASRACLCARPVVCAHTARAPSCRWHHGYQQRHPHAQLKRLLWQTSHNSDGAYTQFDDAQNQIEYILRIIVFACPVVRVVHDATRFIGADLILIDQPPQCTAAVDDVFDLWKRYFC